MNFPCKFIVFFYFITSIEFVASQLLWLRTPKCFQIAKLLPAPPRQITSTPETLFSQRFTSPLDKISASLYVLHVPGKPRKHLSPRANESCPFPSPFANHSPWQRWNFCNTPLLTSPQPTAWSDLLRRWKFVGESLFNMITWCIHGLLTSWPSSAKEVRKLSINTKERAFHATTNVGALNGKQILVTCMSKWIQLYQFHEFSLVS